MSSWTSRAGDGGRVASSTTYVFPIGVPRLGALADSFTLPRSQTRLVYSLHFAIRRQPRPSHHRGWKVRLYHEVDFHGRKVQCLQSSGDPFPLRTRCTLWSHPGYVVTPARPACYSGARASRSTRTVVSWQLVPFFCRNTRTPNRESDA